MILCRFKEKRRLHRHLVARSLVRLSLPRLKNCGRFLVIRRGGVKSAKYTCKWAFSFIDSFSCKRIAHVATLLFIQRYHCGLQTRTSITTLLRVYYTCLFDGYAVLLVSERVHSSITTLPLSLAIYNVLIEREGFGVLLRYSQNEANKAAGEKLGDTSSCRRLREADLQDRK